MRRQGKVDGTHREVVEAFRAAGCSVQSLASVGDGCPDILVGDGGRNRLVEVKRPKGPIYDSQFTWMKRWSGEIPDIVHDAAEALALVRRWRTGR